MKSSISGTTKIAGLIGTPVGHSGSPAMYNYCFEKAGIDCVYMAFDIDAGQVGNMMEAARLLNMKGLNVTMPCKHEAIKYVDQLSPAAELIGACNMIINEGGRFIGHNTDGTGYVRNLRANGIEIKDKKITVVGAGGAGTAIQVQCALDGAREIAVFNARDDFFKKAQEKSQQIREQVPGCRIEVYDLEDRSRFAEEIADCDILANATRVGMKPLEEESIIDDLSLFRKELIVTDVVYQPKETKLMKDADEAGCRKVLGGTGMLVFQGAENFLLYTGQEMPVNEVKQLFF